MKIIFSMRTLPQDTCSIKTKRYDVKGSREHLRTCFDGDVCRVACISYRILDSGEEGTFTGYEGSLISDFLGALRVKTDKPYFITNNANISIPILWKKAVIFQTDPRDIHFKPYGENMKDYFCITEAWTGGRSVIDLNGLLEVLGYDRRSVVSPDEILRNYSDGNINCLEFYCKEDVQAIYEIYKRLSTN